MKKNKDQLKIHDSLATPWEDALAQEIAEGREKYSLDLNKLSLEERRRVGCLAIAKCMLIPGDLLQKNVQIIKIMEDCKINVSTFLLSGLQLLWLISKKMFMVIVVQPLYQVYLKIKQKFSSH